MDSDDRTEWQKAIQEDIDSFIAMEIYEFAPKPDKKVISDRWVYSVKNDESYKEICKTRYVSKGFSQIKDIHRL